MSRRLTGFVLACQAVVLLTLALAVADPPTGPKVVHLLWARSHRPAFYPLILLLFAGPTLTWLAWRTRGPHRNALVGSWLIFSAILFVTLHERALAMLRVLWWQVS